MARLDRLSALLEGLAPDIIVRHAGALAACSVAEASTPDHLLLHLLLEGNQEIRLAGQAAIILNAPAIAVLRGDFAHQLIASSADENHRLFCIEARFAGPAAPLLLTAFTQPLFIDLDANAVDMGLVVNLIASELVAPRCGQPALLKRAGEILFIGLLRYLISHPRTPVGMLNGLAEPRIARALVDLHGTPQAAWTLETLAASAGMSRTAFAVRFRDLMGATPGDYVTQLRLGIARREIAQGNGLKRAAQASGYASTTALSRALSRTATKDLPQRASKDSAQMVAG